jgi:hypothetical protein
MSILYLLTTGVLPDCLITRLFAARPPAVSRYVFTRYVLPNARRIGAGVVRCC